MRKAFNDYGIIKQEEEFIGISLGYDFTSEHEWGIKGMRELFGIPESSKKNMGIKSRTITKCPDNLLFKRDGEYAILWIGHKNWNGEIFNKIPDEIYNYVKNIKWNEEWREKNPKMTDDGHEPMVCAWSENDFGVAVKGKKESAWLEYLFEQFKKKKVAITRLNFGGKNPFSNSSLSLVLIDRLSKEVLNGLFDADKRYYDLYDYEKKIGMKKLKEKKKGGYKEENYFMACSPKWIDYDDKDKREEIKKRHETKYNITYWVNYSDDDDNYGHYIVEEIKKWLSTDGLKLKQIRDAQKKSK